MQSIPFPPIHSLTLPLKSFNPLFFNNPAVLGGNDDFKNDPLRANHLSFSYVLHIGGLWVSMPITDCRK